MLKKAFVLFIAVLITTTALARTNTAAIVKQAVAAWDNGDYAKALELFTQAHEIQPDNPAHLWNMARCNETLGNLKTALAQYRQVLAMHPPKSKLPRLKARIQAVQARLKAQREAAVARQKPKKTALAIQVPKDTVVIVDGGRVGQGGGIVSVKPGHHTVVATREGYRSCTLSVNAPAGKVTRVDCPQVEVKTTKGVWHQPLPSKAKNFSRIVPMLKQGAGVVTTRNHVRYVVTEYGIADLYGKTIRQRVNALLGIAHPDFRADLRKQAHELGYI
jgi:hypothetical protein